MGEDTGRTITEAAAAEKFGDITGYGAEDEKAGDRMEALETLADEYPNLSVEEIDDLLETAGAGSEGSVGLDPDAKLRLGAVNRFRDEIGHKAWVPYQGPRGGEGWRNMDTGDVRYSGEPPGETMDFSELTEEQVADMGGQEMEQLMEAAVAQSDDPGAFVENLGNELGVDERVSTEEVVQAVKDDPSALGRALGADDDSGGDRSSPTETMVTEVSTMDKPERMDLVDSTLSDSQVREAYDMITGRSPPGGLPTRDIIDQLINDASDEELASVIDRFGPTGKADPVEKAVSEAGRFIDRQRGL